MAGGKDWGNFEKAPKYKYESQIVCKPNIKRAEIHVQNLNKYVKLPNIRALKV